MTDEQIVEDGFLAFINATNTRTAGGGKEGYQHMLERVAWTMAADHGDGAVARVFGAIANQFSAKADSA